MTNSLAQALTEALDKRGNELTEEQRNALQGAVGAAEAVEDDGDGFDPWAPESDDPDIAEAKRYFD